jgi:hypothetical protein
MRGYDDEYDDDDHEHPETGKPWRRAAGIFVLADVGGEAGERIREIQPRGPYRLLGSSFGGLLAFEMALQVERAGDAVEFLGMIDTKPAAFARRWTISPARRLRRGRGKPEAEDAGTVAATGTRAAAIHAAARRSYAIADRVASGQDQHRRVDAVLAQPPAEREAVHSARQHDVEQDGIVLAGADQFLGPGGILGQIDDVVLLAQPADQEAADRRIVLDKEQVHNSILVVIVVPAGARLDQLVERGQDDEGQQG